MAIVNMVPHDQLIPGAYLPIDTPREWFAQGKTVCNFALLITHEGRVISEREMNGYNDSDFYALVWEPETRTFREIEFATTRGWCYPCFATKPDANADTLREWEQYCTVARAYAEYLSEQRMMKREYQECLTPRVGKRVRVIRGRKVPLNTDWYVVSDEPSRFQAGIQRLGLRSDDGARVWTNSTNVVVLLPIA